MKNLFIILLGCHLITFGQKKNQGNVEYEFKVDFIQHFKNATVNEIEKSYHPVFRTAIIFNQKNLHYHIGFSFEKFKTQASRTDNFSFESYENGPTYSIKYQNIFEENNSLSKKHSSIRFNIGFGYNFLPNFKHLDIVLNFGLNPQITFTSKTTNAFSSSYNETSNNYNSQVTENYSESNTVDPLKLDIFTNVKHQSASQNKIISFLSPGVGLQINPKVKRFTFLTEIGYRYYRSSAVYINQYSQDDLIKHNQGLYFSAGFRYNITNRTYF